MNKKIYLPVKMYVLPSYLTEVLLHLFRYDNDFIHDLKPYIKSTYIKNKNKRESTKWAKLMRGRFRV